MYPCPKIQTFANNAISAEDRYNRIDYMIVLRYLREKGGGGARVA